MTTQTDRLNTALAGRYRIERHLGEGGMASVYLCEDLKHDRKVALKLLKPELAAVLGAERFVVEIKTTASLHHPHILPLFDSGTADGFLFYVMPYIEGETLRAKLSRETQLGVEESVRIAREVLDALEYAHQHGIVHRDVKPENILLHGGHAMVADFGIALAVSAAAGGRMTETGLSLGTPHYMSPEQATAEKEITARSDVYSLGSVLYEMLAGQPPHLGGSAQQIIMKIIAESVQPVTTLRKAVPPNVAAAVGKALEKLPADRFESAKAFSEALGNPVYTNASAATFAIAAGTANASARRTKRALIGVSVVTLLAVVWGLRGWFRTSPATISHQRILLWGVPQIRLGDVGRRLAVSPHDDAIVFVDSSAGGRQLYIKERSRLEAIAVTGSAGVAGSPAFSPDGAWIAFVTMDGRIKKVPRAGGSATTVSDSANALLPVVAWLDGGVILFTDAQFGLREVGERGGRPRLIFAGPARFGSDSTARAVVSATGLPGGKAALVGTCSPGCRASELRLIDLSSATVTVLAPDVLAGWSLPGGVVAFVRPDGGVFAVPLDLRTRSFARAPIPMLLGIRTSDATADLAVSAGGTAIYVAGGAGPGQDVQPVWVTRAGAVTPIDTGWTINLGVQGGKGIALSPDGRRLAVTIHRPGAPAEHDIWIKQLDHGPLSKLTLEGENIGPAWTADGQEVLYVSGARRPGSVRRQHASGAGRLDTILTLSRNVYEVVPTRDSALFILRLSTPPSRDIVWERRGDSATTPLLASPLFDEVAPALSPDGRWLAYSSNESGRFEVYVRPYPDVNSGRWQVSTAGGVSPIWARSGRELFYWNKSNAVEAASVVTGHIFELVRRQVLFDASRFAINGYVGDFDVAPDGRRFVFLRPVGASTPASLDTLIQVTNWATEVQAKLAGKAPK